MRSQMRLGLRQEVRVQEQGRPPRALFCPGSPADLGAAERVDAVGAARRARALGLPSKAAASPRRCRINFENPPILRSESTPSPTLSTSARSAPRHGERPFMRATLARNCRGVNALGKKSPLRQAPDPGARPESAGSPPSTRTVPLVGRTTPSSVLMNVVLPAPLRPMSPNAAPRWMAMSRSPRAPSVRRFGGRSPR